MFPRFIAKSSLLLTLVVAFSAITFSQEDPALRAGSPERRAICQQFADYFQSAHETISDGVSAEQLKKQIEIDLAGQEDQEYSFILLFGVDMANLYFEQGLNAAELTTDFLYECVTTSDVVLAVLMTWFENEIPVDHPLRDEYFAQGAASPSNIADFAVDEDGSLAPKSYYALLGDEYAGTQAIVAYDRRRDGKIKSCGFEFSHVIYDRVYSMGQPIKVSGSVNISSHPVNVLAGLVKIKAEKITIFVGGSEPSTSANVISLDSIYSTSAGKPILENVDNFECEDSEYKCHVVFSWEILSEATMQNSLGLAYKPAGGRTDVILDLDLARPEGAEEENLKYMTCMMELLTSTRHRLEMD